MAIVTSAPISTVLVGGHEPATMRAELAHADPPTFSAELSRDLIDGFDAPSVVSGVWVEWNGEDITALLTDSSPTFRRSIDTPGTRCVFTVRGRRFSPYVTEGTWTRAGEWAAGYYQGLPGRVRKLEKVRGPVVSLQPTGNGGGPVYTIEIADAGHPPSGVGVCFELPPKAGQTRGQIAREICAAHGVELAAPDGPIYTKPVQFDNVPLGGLMNQWFEPAGLKIRRSGSGLQWEAYRPEIKDDDRPPDWVWSLDDVQGFLSSPPEGVASRWIVRSEQTIDEDEDGQEIQTSTLTVEDVFAPEVALQQQDEHGTVSSTGLSQPSPALQVIRKSVEESTSQGGRLLRKVIKEFGWYNPRAAKLRTANGGGGPVAPGYYYSAAYIDAGGEFRLWREQRFIEISRRVETYEYDESGTETGVRVELYSWRGIPRAVRSSNAPVTNQNVDGTLIAGDDRSYQQAATPPGGIARAIEEFGLSQVQTAAYEYGQDGAETTETAETFQIYSLPAPVDDDGWVLSNGSVQADREAFLQLVHREIKTSITDESGRLAAESTARSGYYIPQTAGGAFNYGDVESNSPNAVWATLGRESREFRVGRDGTFVEILANADGHRREIRQVGEPPLPRYLASAWTQTASQPVEASADDPVLEHWFGFRSEVVEHPYALSLAECGVIAVDRRSRQLTHEISVTRPETLAEPGDTVLIVDPEQAIEHRALLTEVRTTRSAVTGEAMATYTLEARAA